MLDIEIDRLTESILEVSTGLSLDTIVKRIGDENSLLLTHSWRFDWLRELRANPIYQLLIEQEETESQGLISLKDLGDNISVSLIENAPHNIGRNKRYEGVAGNLFAFACKASFDRGYEGYVSFLAKTELVDHYKRTLGAKSITSQLMYIDSAAATNLVNHYFK